MAETARQRGRGKADVRTGEAVTLGPAVTKLGDLVRLYIRVNGGRQERSFQKRISPPQCDDAIFVGIGTHTLFHDVEEDCLRKAVRRKDEGRTGIQMVVRILKREGAYQVFVPHAENKVWEDAVHMEVKGTSARLVEFFLSTGADRAAMKWGGGGFSKAHLWAMRSLELVAFSLGATTLSLTDASSTRIKRWISPKRFFYVDIPNRSALLKIQRDDFTVHTYKRYGFSPMRRPSVATYVSSSLPVRFFVALDAPSSFPEFLFSKEEMNLSLSSLTESLLAEVREEILAY